MPTLIQADQVLLRLAEIPGLKVPAHLTPERVEVYIDSAAGDILTRAGLTVAPADGTASRNAMNGLCARLVVNMILSDILALRADAKDVYMRERAQLLEEAVNFSEEEGSSDILFEVF